MGFLGDIGLLYTFAIILGGLIVVVFTTGLARLYWMKRRLAKHKIKHDIETAERAVKEELGSQQDLGEGDLFGVRAIEKGFYGGVAQSQSTTTTNSSRSSPTTIVDSDGISIPCSSSAGSSARDFSLLKGTSQTGSITRDESAMSLCLQRSETELAGRRNHDPSIVVNAYIPNFTAEFEDPATAQAHSKSVCRTATPSSILQANQVQSYAQRRLPNQKTGFRSTSRSESTTSPRRDIIFRYHASSGPESDPGIGRRRIRCIPSPEPSLAQVSDSSADMTVEASTKSSRPSSKQDVTHYVPSEQNKGTAGPVLGRIAGYFVPVSSPLEDQSDSSENISTVTIARLEIEIVVCPVNGSGTFI